MFDPTAAKGVLLLMGDILDRLKIPFFLMQGTALGAYRDRGFCPTEKDIDIGILLEDLQPKVPGLLQYLMDENLDVEAFVRPTGKPRTVVVWADGAKVDLVGMARHKKWRYTFGPYRPWDVLQDGKRYALVHEARLLETYRTVNLFGRDWNVPSPIETYLEREYGPEWRTPLDDSESRTRVYGFLEREGIVNV